MIVDPVAQALHQKATLGGVLTPDEHERLLQWYARLDKEEAAMLATACQRENEQEQEVQAKIDEAMAALITEAEEIQALEKENKRIRSEIEALKTQLAQKRVPQSA